MKKIVPFNNVLEFNTDVKEITAISLEHEINKSPDMISGVFYISGEYKITEGLLDREKFNFELPFDIALSNNYRTNSLLVDIDDFRYELISDKNLKINIDLYIDGEVEEPEPIERNIEIFDFLDNEEPLQATPEVPEEPELNKCLELTEELKLTENESKLYKEISSEEKSEPKLQNEQLDEIEPERIELLKEMLTDNKEKDMEPESNINNNENTNINIFEPSNEEKYVTYRVYKVEETDTIDTIISKYNINKELLADYNNIENIKPGDKLIIPTNEK